MTKREITVELLEDNQERKEKEMELPEFELQIPTDDEFTITMGYLASLPPVLENERTIIQIPELPFKDTIIFDLDETLFCAKVSDSLSYW